MPTVKSSKQKGRVGQQEIRDKILETFPELEPDDVKSTTMGDTGEDIQLSPAARKKMPVSIEVKRRKSGMKIQYDWIAQARRHGKGEPVLFFRADRSDWIVVVGLEHYMELLRGWKRD
jgi:hypothetical protein